jgi:predicted nucleotidyltransferase
MKEEQLDELKKTLIDVLTKNEVKKAAIFGSIVRRESTDGNYRDLLIESEGRKMPQHLYSCIRV